MGAVDPSSDNVVLRDASGTPFRISPVDRRRPFRPVRPATLFHLAKLLEDPGNRKVLAGMTAGVGRASGPRDATSKLRYDLDCALRSGRLRLEPVPLITATLLRSLMSALSPDRAPAFAAALDTILPEYGIDTIDRVAAFLGQTAVESRDYMHLSEDLYYRDAARLVAIFPSRFPTTASAQPYVKNSKKLGNFVYADRLGNGDVASGDGYRYRGRGLIQLTGKGQYEALDRDTALGSVGDPTVCESIPGAVRSAAWYWQNAGLNAYVDRRNFAGLTKRVNAKSLEASRRDAIRKRAVTLLRSSGPPIP